ncbi:hypothetical protein [Agaribacterium sp. ZY112]|uniref:YybH family protein n=1 Tax=Agaribacterium sp. ZY112 TaxID=3233574 RepID=UPI0035262983
MDNEQNKVIDCINNMTSAFHQQHIDQVMANYEEGAAVMFEPRSATSDTTEVQHKFEAAFQIKPQFAYPKGHEVHIANGIALHIAPWIMKGQTPDGTDIEQSGLSVAVLRQQEDNSWRLVLDNPYGSSLLENN